jgi:hypothetical protein
LVGVTAPLNASLGFTGTPHFVRSNCHRGLKSLGNSLTSSIRVTKVSRVFLCHNSLDKEQVKALALLILKTGAVRSWLDTWEIAGGRDWEDHIRREFASSWSCLVFVGKNGLGPYQQKEIGWARQRADADPDYRVVPVLLEDADAAAISSIEEALPRIHWVRLEGGSPSSDSIAGVLKALRGDRPGPPAFAISVAVAAEQWDVAGRSDESAMLRGQSLEQARLLMAADTAAFDALSLAYIAASATAEQKRGRRLIGGLVVVAGVFLLGALWANQQRLRANEATIAATTAQTEAEGQRDAASAARKAEADQKIAAEQARDDALTQRDLADQRRKVAESQALAADARRMVPQEVIASLVKGVSAYRASPTTEAQIALLEGLSRVAKLLRVFRCPAGAKATTVALAPQATTRLVYACRDKVTTLTVVSEQGQVLRTLRRDEDIREIVFVNDGRLAFGAGRQLVIADVASGEERAIPLALPISALTVDRDSGALYAGNSSGEILRWSAPCCDASAAPTVAYKLPRGGVSGVAWRGEGALQVDAPGDSSVVIDLSGAVIKRPLLFRAVEGNLDLLRSCDDRFPRPSNRYYALAGVPSNTAFGYVTEANDVVVVRRTSQGCFRPTVLAGHTHNVLRLTLSQDARIAASAGAIIDADDGHGVALWDVEQVHPLAQHVPLPKVVQPFARPSLALSADGRSWACGGCSAGVIWDGQEVPQVQPVASTPALAMSSDGTTLAVALPNRRVAQLERGARGRPSSSQWTADGEPRRLWIGSHATFTLNADGSVTRLRGGRTSLVRGPAPDSEARCAALDPSGDGVLFRDGKAALVRQPLDGGPVTRFGAHQAHGSCGELVGGAQLLIRVSSEYEPMYVFGAEAAGGKSDPWPNPMRAHSGLRTLLRDGWLSHDGRLLVARSDGDGLALFNVPERRAIGLLSVPDLSAVALSADGRRVLTFARGQLLRWNVAPEEMAARAAALSGGQVAGR